MSSKFKKNFNKNKDFKVLMGPEGNETLILYQITKLSLKYLKKGTYLINNGHRLLGVANICVGINFIQLEVSYLLIKLFPKDFLKTNRG